MKHVSQLLRQAVRKMVPEQAYLFMARQYAASASKRVMGRAEYRRLVRTRNAKPGGEAQHFSAPGIPTPVKVRPGTTDASVFEDTLIRRMYGVLAPKPTDRFVIDAGANAGYTSVFFANRWAGAKTIALEPDSGNFALAESNNAPYPHVKVKKQALWPTQALLRVEVNERADAIRVVEVTDPTQADCSAVDPMTLAREAQQPRISLFKIDIEGAEEPLFKTNPDPWLDITDNIMMEIHSPAAEEAVYSAISRHRFESFRYRELHVFSRR